jgi:hypothetical protein
MKENELVSALAYADSSMVDPGEEIVHKKVPNAMVV